MAQNIPNPPAYHTVDADDFASLIDPPRYGQRTSSFDEIIAATESHYWNPDDPRYIDYDRGFNLEAEFLLPVKYTPELRSAVADRLDEQQRFRFASELARFHLSQSLHAEQCGVSMCAHLCTVFRDPAAQEYAANQAREETRHVRALARYIAARWGSPLPAAGGTVASLLGNLVSTDQVHKKIVGMQLVAEGMALGGFSVMQAGTRDPVLARMLQLILTDESYHHRFGRIWGQETIPNLNEEQHTQVENWAAGCFLSLSHGLFGGEAKQEVYARFGLDWKWVDGALGEAFVNPALRRELGLGDVFRILVKSLMHTGIMTARTRPLYRTWFDLEALAQDESHEDDAYADRTVAELREINRGMRRVRAL